MSVHGAIPDIPNGRPSGFHVARGWPYNDRMPLKKSQPRPVGAAPAVSPQAAWRVQANALLEGPSTMRERNWTRLYIEGRTPAEAAAIANTYVHNNQVPRDRKR